MNSYMSYQMALVRQAQLLRDAEQRRHAEPAACPRVRGRITDRIRRVMAGNAGRRGRLVTQDVARRSAAG